MTIRDFVGCLVKRSVFPKTIHICNPFSKCAEFNICKIPGRIMDKRIRDIHENSGKIVIVLDDESAETFCFR